MNNEKAVSQKIQSMVFHTTPQCYNVLTFIALYKGMSLQNVLRLILNQLLPQELKQPTYGCIYDDEHKILNILDAGETLAQRLFLAKNAKINRGTNQEKQTAVPIIDTIGVRKTLKEELKDRYNGMTIEQYIAKCLILWHHEIVVTNPKEHPVYKNATLTDVANCLGVASEKDLVLKKLNKPAKKLNKPAKEIVDRERV